jgi:hypothetical protein
MVVIGSKALQCRFPHLGIEPKDLDLVGTYDEAQQFRRDFKATVFYPINSGKSLFMRNAEGMICEIEIAWDGSRAEKMLAQMANDPWYDKLEVFSDFTWLQVPTVNMLYLLKLSHRYLKDSPHFLKTMRDIQTLRKLGAEVPEAYQNFYKQRMADTYTNTLPKLNMSKGGFFDVSTGVPYVYDHDSIHEAVRHLQHPAYWHFKPADSEVMVSKAMWDTLPHFIKLYAVLEESYVLSLERSLIPFPGIKTPKEGFDMAFMKVCTSITSGWFREFCYNSYDEVQELYNDSYISKFKAGVVNGTVKLFNQ